MILTPFPPELVDALLRMVVRSFKLLILPSALPPGFEGSLIWLILPSQTKMTTSQL
ncbi:MAG: hypothetical protein ACTSPQ_20235 [Candidatus Helarchaeota archaeon]